MLCLSAGALAVSLSVSQFTLVWTHSIEKIRWEEDWRIEDRQLVIDSARIRGSGAGMEIPADAKLKDGVWHYRPPLAPQASLRLSHSPYTTGYDICTANGCRPLAGMLPGLDNTANLLLAPCPP